MHHLMHCAICGHTPKTNQTPFCHNCWQWYFRSESSIYGAHWRGADSYRNTEMWNKRQIDLSLEGPPSKRLRAIALSQIEPCMTRQEFQDMHTKRVTWPEDKKDRKKEPMNSTRKKAAAAVISLLVLIVAGVLGYVATIALDGLLMVLTKIGYILAAILTCTVVGAVLYSIASVAWYACGWKNSPFERIVLAWWTKRREQKQKAPPPSKTKMGTWGSVADGSVKLISKKLKKLKPGDNKRLKELTSLCKSKMADLAAFLVKGDDVIAEADEFLKTYEDRKTALKKIQDELAAEIKALKSQPGNPLGRSVRSMKAQQLIETQNKIKRLDSEKNHHEYMAGTVNSTRLLITQARGSVETVLEELKLKQKRDEILGG